MNKVSLSFSTPSIPDQYRDVFNLYVTRELAVNLVNQINHLISGVQRHRGISMALLAGDRSFELEFVRLQGQIEKRIAMLAVFASSNGQLISVRDDHNMRLAWKTIREGWQDDKVSDNFELHSHFIEQLLVLMQKVARSLETPLVNKIYPEETADSFSRHGEQIELLSFICSLLPGLIENMAKIRGLASFAAARGDIDYQHDRKLRFCLQSAREQHDKVRQCAQRLHDVLRGELSSKYVIGELETKFAHLIDVVMHDVLSGKTIKVSSSHIFSLATDIIDRYWGTVDDGLDVLGRWHRADLETWLNLV